MAAAGDPGRARNGRNRAARGLRAASERAGTRAASARLTASGRAAARAERSSGGTSPTRSGPPAPGGAPTPGGKVRAGVAGGAPDAIRGSRAHRVAVATSGMLGVSSTRRAAVLALVVCALALTVAVPLRNFLTQRQELSALQAKQRQLTVQVDELTRRRDELRDPTAVAAEARERLGYVRPGETPYVVQLPSDVAVAVSGSDAAAHALWYDRLWSEVRGVPK